MPQIVSFFIEIYKQFVVLGYSFAIASGTYVVII